MRGIKITIGEAAPYGEGLAWRYRKSPTLWEYYRQQYAKFRQWLDDTSIKVEEYGDGTYVARITQQCDTVVPPKRGMGNASHPIPCDKRDDISGCVFWRGEADRTHLVDLVKKSQRVNEAVLRARRQVRSYVRNSGLTRLLTFTNGDSASEGFASAEEAYDMFALWWRVHGKRLLPAGGVVVVAEQGGKNGRWHLHALCTKDVWFSYNRVRETWSGLLENKGYHSATGTHRFHAGDEDGRAKRGFKSTRIAAAYASKYLGKGMRGGRRRFRSYECRRPRTVRFRVKGLDSALDTIYGRYGQAVHYMMWAASPDGVPRTLIVDGDVTRE